MPNLDLNNQQCPSLPRAAASNAELAVANQRLLNTIDDILLTCLDSDDPQPNASSERKQPETQSRPRVLLIDDDHEYICALQMRLEHRGLAVARATTGLDGFCCAVGESTDVILLDYQLPNGRGDYILEQLKANPTTKHIPVIVISGSHDRALENTLVNGGAANFLHKPLDFEHLMRELRKHVAV
jgi:response regulator RpfG family c-di-GMP phosphodiesterase